MNLYLFSINKRLNSTKRPDLSTGKELTVQLKDEISFENPVFKIKSDVIGGTFTPVAFNYAYAPYWMRYYFITDWKFINGCWECYCSVDVLASFKNQISNTSAYVTRAASNYDGTIIDDFYPAKSNVNITKVNTASSWYGIAPSGGSYVVGCINNQLSGRVGAVSYYALTASQLGQLLDYLFSNTIYNASSITEVGEGLFKSMFDPFQYIVSCVWFPFASSAFGSSQTYISVGYWTTTIQGIVVTSIAEKTFVTATIPNHPQISRGEYLNRAPYTRLTLFIPPFGSIPIDTNFITVGRYLYSAVLVDHITGQATIRLSLCASANNLDEFNLITERSGMIGVPIQLSQVLPDYVGTAHSVASTIGSIATGNLAGALSGMLSAVQTQMPSVTSSGANGSFAETMLYPTLIAEHLLLADEDLTEFGRPLCAVRQLGNLTGFIQCGEDDLPFNGTRTEIEEVNRFLKEGFFME